MIDLDDEGALRARDPSRMLDAVTGLSRQCREGHEIGRGAGSRPSTDAPSNVVICGMGGSAVAGDVLRVLLAGSLPWPVVVVRSPELPAFVGPRSLVLASSYSGNTAETLACFEEAVERGALVAAITSGGRLAGRCEELGVPVARVPAGMQPRAAFGYLALGSIGLLESMGVLPSAEADLDEAVAELETQEALCAPSVPTLVNPAKQIAAAIGERVPEIWGAEGLGAVAAARWKTQLNENAKIPAFAASLPELDHNEVEGWSPGQGARFVVVALRHEGEPEDVAMRFPPTIELAREAGAEVTEVWARGGSGLARLLTLVSVGDHVATYLGLGRGVDPSSIDAIARLKRTLAEA